MYDNNYFLGNSTEDILKDKIKDIDNIRDELEQKFYRDKIRLEAEYHTTSSTLLSEKSFYKSWLKSIDSQKISIVDKSVGA